MGCVQATQLPVVESQRCLPLTFEHCESNVHCAQLPTAVLQTKPVSQSWSRVQGLAQTVPVHL